MNRQQILHPSSIRHQPSRRRRSSSVPPVFHRRSVFRHLASSSVWRRSSQHQRPNIYWHIKNGPQDGTVEMAASAHSDEKHEPHVAFSCNECSRSFSRKDNLVRRLKINSQSRRINAASAITLAMYLKIWSDICSYIMTKGRSNAIFAKEVTNMQIR